MSVPAGIAETARSIASAQLPSGAISWPDGHVDPWDHVECAMALSACGLTSQARLAYQWLRDSQRADGSWPRAFEPRARGGAAGRDAAGNGASGNGASGNGASGNGASRGDAAGNRAGRGDAAGNRAGRDGPAGNRAGRDGPAGGGAGRDGPAGGGAGGNGAGGNGAGGNGAGGNGAGGLAVADQAAESHHAAYVAVGAWHELLVTGDAGFARQMWPTVRRAVEWVLGLQAPRGEIAWERDAAGEPGGFALLSGCASILQGLRCAIALAELAGDPRPDWELAADQLAHVIARHPEAFADKSRFAMDWYYPVLGGAVRDAEAARRLAARWDTFVVPGLGVRCVRDQPWVTVAETCELALTLDACGMRMQAAELFAAVRHLRHDDGSYWTGWQFANENHFPAERSSWTAAAVILAADALTGFSNGAAIFRDPFPAGAAPAGTAPAGTAWTAPVSRPPADPAACGCSPASATAIPDLR